MTKDNPRVVYIGSCSRSGSTLLTMLLGTAEGLFAAGETKYVWDRAILKGALCGCGEPYQNCPVWSRVLTVDVLGDEPEVIAERVVSLQKVHLRLRHAQQLYRQIKSGRLSQELIWYRDLHTRIYTRLSKVTGAHTIVDSSKDPQEALLLTTSNEIDFQFVHLIRDPRGVIASWKRTKKQFDGRSQFLSRLPPHQGAPRWTLSNLGCERVTKLLKDPDDHSATVHYEELASNPDVVMTRLTQTLSVPAIRRERLYKGSNHIIAGNPDRFNRRPREIRLDERWRNSLNHWDLFVTWLFTSSLRRRYISANADMS